MNAETVDLIQRPFAEIVDDLLIAVVGGVVNEPVRFDVKAAVYPLAEPATDIRGVTGQIGDEHVQFLKEVDFAFSAGDNALVWREQGRQPKDDTVFYVDYFRRFSNSPLTDINVGSVTRTLCEAIAREAAFVYRQINLAYLGGFIDTATGKALDLVVAILGVVRKTADYAEGLETFIRDPAAGDGNITIPEGVLLRTAKGDATFTTTQQRTMQRGTGRIDVPVRATEESKGPAGRVAAGQINTLVQTVTGVSRVTNFDETLLGADDETDEELRARAKAVLRGLGKATLAALMRVVAEERADLKEHWDPNRPEPDKRSPAGMVALLIDTKPGRIESIRNAVQETRAAGVQAVVVARAVLIKPRVVVKIRPGLTAAGKLKIIDQLIAATETYLDKLEPGSPALGAKMADAMKKVPEVLDVEFRDVIVRSTDLSQAVPTGELKPDRRRLQNLQGGPAQDADLHSAQFQISPNGDPSGGWLLVLDMEPSDVTIVEGT